MAENDYYGTNQHVADEDLEEERASSRKAKLVNSWLAPPNKAEPQLFKGLIA